MTINISRGLLLGAALLGAGTLLASTSPVSAQPRQNVKVARQNVKVARQNLRQQQAQARNRRNVRPGYGAGIYGQNYNGQVTRVRSTQSFDVSIGGSTFNVYTVSRLPRGLSVGDRVRVTGTKQYNNDIRNASVSIIRNR